MKNLFNDISQEEKTRILEMHTGKKNVIKEQSIGDAVNWAKDKINSLSPKTISSFKAQATVEDDMSMSFPVVEFNYDNSDVTMFFKEGNQILNVKNFEGPIYDRLTKKYDRSYFRNINSKNWKTIAKQYNIPVSEVMV